MITVLSLMVIFAVLNRARGCHLYGMTGSTVVSRVVPMAIMAGLSGGGVLQQAIAFGLLMLWCTPAWDKYWSEEIGHSATHSRLYGLMQMTARQSLILPCYLFLAGANSANPLWAMTFLLNGLPYYIMGYTKHWNPIGISEYAVGAIVGLTVGMLYVG